MLRGELQALSNSNPSDVNLAVLSPLNRKAKPTMAKRSGQSGTLVRKGNFWHIRYLADTPAGRIRKSYPVGRIDEITKTQAKRLGSEYLHKIGVNTAEYLERSLAAAAFKSALKKWQDARLVGFKPSGKLSSWYVVNKHIAPRFGGMLLEQVDSNCDSAVALSLRVSKLCRYGSTI